MGATEVAIGAHVEIVMGLMVEHQLGPSFLQAEVNNGIKHDTYRKHTGHGSNANVENLGIAASLSKAPSSFAPASKSRESEAAMVNRQWSMVNGKP